jgi:HTH-type transcriptional regulator/antitoxin HigA
MTRIENEAQYAWAVAKVEALLPLVDDDTPLDDPRCIELVLLSNLVADYSDEHFAIGTPSLVDLIRLRMYEMGLTQKALAQLLGISPARMSEIISGKKEPTYHIARDISRKLNIDPSIVLGVG